MAAGKTGRGGRRAGAGRPPIDESLKTNKRKHSLYCSPDELRLLRAFLSDVRTCRAMKAAPDDRADLRAVAEYIAIRTGEKAAEPEHVQHRTEAEPKPTETIWTRPPVFR